MQEANAVETGGITEPVAKSLVGYMMVAIIGTILMCMLHFTLREIDANGTGHWNRPISSISTAASWRADSADISIELPTYGSLIVVEEVSSQVPRTQ